MIYDFTKNFSLKLMPKTSLNADLATQSPIAIGIQKAQEYINYHY